MKKWLIILSIIFAAGFITSAALAGKVYYSGLQTYEDYDKQVMDLQALENIHIQSAVPVEIHPTKGEPYAEFTQKFTDLVGLAPKYELKIEEKGNSTQINLNAIEEIIVYLGVKEDQAKLTVYLPEGTINRLEIVGYGYRVVNKHRENINLENINVNELKIDTDYAEIHLDGNYNKVNIRALNGILNMKSKTLAKLNTSGIRHQYIEGLFEKINIENSRGDVTINSLKPCKAEIESYNSNIQLEGQFAEINMNGYDMEVELNSETDCKLLTQGNNNMIYANGSFGVMDFKEVGSKIEVQTTVIPKSIKMLESACETSLTLTLPSNIKGITLKYMNQNGGTYDYYYDEADHIEPSFADHEFKLESDFLPFNQEIENGHFIYKYGDGEVKIVLNQNAEISLELIDGGYTSVSKAE